VANSLTISGVVVTAPYIFSTKSGGKVLSFRVKNETIKGRLREVVYIQVNVYNEGQRERLLSRNLQTGDRVWVLGEIMARYENDGKDVLEVRGNQVDPVVKIQTVEVDDDGV